MRERLSVERLRCGYRDRTVVRDATFSVAEGEFCALLGLNGCGKTTLIRTICGAIPPQGGVCRVDGEDCTAMDERQRALRISYIPQRGSLIVGRTVMDVVLMGHNVHLGLLDSPGRAHRRSAEEALALLGLEGFGDRDYGRLSEGQKQLAILARALVQDAPVMVMDEPDSALDFVNRHMVLSKICQILRGQGRAGLISLHDPNFALTYCDRLVLMRGGEIWGELSPRTASVQELTASLSEIYGDVQVLRHGGGYVMVKGGPYGT